MPLDLLRLTSELSDLATTYTDREEKATALLTATDTKADTEANGRQLLADLDDKHASERAALLATITTANVDADVSLTAATVASQVAATLCQRQIEYVVGLVRAESDLTDPTPTPAAAG